MPEWFAVLLAGGAGGFIQALMARDVTWIFLYRDDRGRRACDFGTLGTMCIGAGAGIISWGFYGPDDLMASHVIPARVIAGALVAGAGGGRIIKAYADQALNKASDKETGEAMGRLTSMVTNAQSSSPPAHAESPDTLPKHRKRDP